MRIPLSVPAARPLDVLAVGLNSIDLLAVIDGHPAANAKTQMHEYAELPGGQAASAASAMARLGLRTGYIGRFGDDDFGRRGLDSLRAEGVDVTHVVTVPGATSQFAMVLVDRLSGTRTVLWNRHPGLAMAPADVPAVAVQAARVLHVDCHETAAVAAAAAAARRAGTRTVVDVERVRPGLDQLLRHIDVVIAAESFPVEYTGATSLGAGLAALQRDTGAAVVCVTLGAQGSLCLASGREYPDPGLRRTGRGFDRGRRRVPLGLHRRLAPRRAGRRARGRPVLGQRRGRDEVPGPGRPGSLSDAAGTAGLSGRASLDRARRRDDASRCRGQPGRHPAAAALQ